MIACVDADCIADSRWIESASNALAAGGLGTIHGGDVQIARQSPGRFTEVEAYEAVFGYRQKLYITKKHFSRSEEHTSELQSLMRISYAVFCLKKKKNTQKHLHNHKSHIHPSTE